MYLYIVLAIQPPLRYKANAFEECSLNNITIRSSSTKVYCGAFGKLGDNTFITLPQELVYYTKPYYVQEDNITVTVSTSPAASEPEFHIQDGVLLGVYLPANCHTVTLPDTIEKIAKNVFFYSNIESVVLPNSLKLIEEHAFNHCNKLKNITILPGNESIIIEGDAFSNGFDDITKLESITISNPNALSTPFTLLFMKQSLQYSFVPHCIIDLSVCYAFSPNV